MEQPQEKNVETIKTIGLVIMIYAGLMIVGNALGIIIWNRFSDIFNHTGVESIMPFAYVFEHYRTICFVMLGMGFGLLIGGLFIRKFRRWAAILTSIISLVFIVLLWIVNMVIYNEAKEQELFMITGAAIIGSGVIRSAMFVVLIWFLNRRSTRELMH